ncbi:hypothetical protein P8631_11530 (plasmid) [Guyparkeria sp. 1SP6A2]|nr:hypothetical protein [Guyparkeria sp. 1SP6A2]
MDDELTNVFARIETLRQRRVELETQGQPALERLVAIASGESHQCIHIRHFLLGLYNGPVFPFDMTRLRALDEDIQADALTVLEADMTPRVEIHERIENGSAIFDAWATKEIDKRGEGHDV